MVIDVPVSFGIPFISSICSIYSLCMGIECFGEFYKKKCCPGIFDRNPSIIRQIVRSLKLWCDSFERCSDFFFFENILDVFGWYDWEVGHYKP